MRQTGSWFFLWSILLFVLWGLGACSRPPVARVCASDPDCPTGMRCFGGLCYACTEGILSQDASGENTSHEPQEKEPVSLFEEGGYEPNGPDRCPLSPSFNLIHMWTALLLLQDAIVFRPRQSSSWARPAWYQRQPKRIPAGKSCPAWTWMWRKKPTVTKPVLMKKVVMPGSAA